MLRLSARRRCLAIRAGSVLVLLLAVSPQVLYLGRPGAASGSAVHTASVHHQHQEETEAEHANHCHVGPKSCAPSEDAAQVRTLSDAAYAILDSSDFRALEGTQLFRSFALYQRPEKPPRPA